MVLQAQVKEDEEMIRDIPSEMIDTINLPVVPSHPRLPTVTSFPYFQSTDIRIKQGLVNKETGAATWVHARVGTRWCLKSPKILGLGAVIFEKI